MACVFGAARRDQSQTGGGSAVGRENRASVDHYLKGSAAKGGESRGSS